MEINLIRLRHGTKGKEIFLCDKNFEKRVCVHEKQVGRFLSCDIPSSRHFISSADLIRSDLFWLGKGWCFVWKKNKEGEKRLCVRYGNGFFFGTATYFLPPPFLFFFHISTSHLSFRSDLRRKRERIEREKKRRRKVLLLFLVIQFSFHQIYTKRFT